MIGSTEPPAGRIGRLWARLRSRDPNGYALKRALRAAVIVPINFAIGSELIGNAQVATFAAFGSFALLMFANFTGGTRSRIGAYVGLALAGAVLIVVGSAVATPDWLAVVGMGVIAFVVMFVGVVSSTISAGTQAALLAGILAIMLPGGSLSVAPERLAGWGIACAVAIPVAVFVWPPTDQDVLRTKTAALCRALARMLALDPSPAAQGDPLVAMRQAARELDTAFRASAAHTAALSTGARLLVRLVDELDWLVAAVTNACADGPEVWPEQGRRLRATAQEVLDASAAALLHVGDTPDASACAVLRERVDALGEARRAVADETLLELRHSATREPIAQLRGEFGRPLYAAHELGYAVTLVGDTVSTIAAADSRSWWSRLLGRGFDSPDSATAAQRVATGHLNRHSVWLQNSVRAAIGLAAAVLIARLVGAQNAFWIGLGALSVLRSNALSTGSTVVRALLGTVIGFAVGGALVAVIGTSPAVLWPLLPVIILFAASAPTVLSFAAGQAGFTVFTIILFNIIAPQGWTVGVLRVEDVALGCAASLVAGALFWPRGAAPAFLAALADAYRTSADYLRESIHVSTGRPARAPEPVGSDASAAGLRLDDALRQYLAERGAKHVDLEAVTALANGAARVRLAGRAIAQLRHSAPDGRLVGTGPDALLRRPADVLATRGDGVTDWYTSLATGFADHAAAPPAVPDSDAGASFLDVVLPAVNACGDPDCAGRAERLLWSGQYLGDVDRIRADLVKPAAAVASAQARAWWRR